MELRKFDGKEEKEILAKALEELEVTEDEVVYYVTKTKGGLLKKEVVTLHVATLKMISEFI